LISYLRSLFRRQSREAATTLEGPAERAVATPDNKQEPAPYGEVIEEAVELVAVPATDHGDRAVSVQFVEEPCEPGGAPASGERSGAADGEVLEEPAATEANIATPVLDLGSLSAASSMVRTIKVTTTEPCVVTSAVPWMYVEPSTLDRAGQHVLQIMLDAESLAAGALIEPN